jgi:hypothetical protein
MIGKDWGGGEITENWRVVRSMSVMKDDWAPVVSESTDVGRQLSAKSRLGT